MSVRRVGLIGNPVEHSRSPKMHNAAFAALAMPHTYELWHTESDDVASKVTSLRDPGIAGANVTVPHKQAVMPFLDEITEAAHRIGAVNTIIPRGDRLVGDNTDAYGFTAAILEKYPDFAAETAVVLGAGGASRAVVVALQQMGAREVVVVNRTESKAQAISDELGASHVPWSALADLVENASIVVNATSLGWHDEEVLPAEVMKRIPVTSMAVDLTYRNTPFLLGAAAYGVKHLDGLGMLIHQGARSFELWFEVQPPVEVMRAALSD